MTSQAHLKRACLQQGHLVVLGQIAESGDMFGELYHLPDGGRERQREVLPYLLWGLRGVGVRLHVHWTSLRREDSTVSQLGDSL